MKIVDWRTRQSLKVGEIADWGPAPKSYYWCDSTKGEIISDPQRPGKTIGIIKDTSPLDLSNCSKRPYPPEEHSPGYKLLDVKEISWTQGQVKIQFLKNSSSGEPYLSDRVIWWPLSIRFLTKDGLRVGYIID